MTINEILKSNGVNDEGVKAILEAMKSNKIFTASEENLDIRYGKLKTDHEGATKQLAEAQHLIEELKKGNKGNEDLQQKVAAYENQVQQLQKELTAAKIDSAIQVGLLAANATDVDYLTFKLKEKGELQLGEDGKISGWDDKLAALKTQLPNHFASNGQKKVMEQKLPDGSGTDSGITKEAFAKMGYQERLKLFNENPDTYAELNKN